jgi:hypothetical protein
MAMLLARQCGDLPWPERRLERADGSDLRHGWGSGGVCPLGSREEAFIRVEPGAVYVDTLRLYNTDSPFSQPPITMEMRAGAFGLVYRATRPGVLGLGGLLELRSNAFVIRLP